MCGRVAYIWDPVTGKLVQKVDDRSLDDPDRSRVLKKKRYNVPPASHLPVFGLKDGGTRVEIARWGFPIPARRNGVFNTRIETAAESPMWRGMLGKSHCVFPVKGFYEWEHDGAKRPHYIHRKDDDNLLLAGLLGRRTVGGESKLCASIVTCKPNELVGRLHDRMPVVLEERDLDAWLNPQDSGMERVMDLAKPAADGVLTMHAVGAAVNSTKNDAPELMQPTSQKTLGA